MTLAFPIVYNAESGQAWALKINEHTSNRALWQYVHDAFAHIEEDILVHGTGDRNDDAILEKGNRRKKRLGDRCVFRGGKNNGVRTYKIRVKEMVAGKWTGSYVPKEVTRRTVAGQAAQVMILDTIAQIREATRATASASLSAKEVLTKAEEKVARATQRAEALTTITNYADEKKRPRDGCDSAAGAAAPAVAPAVPGPAAMPTFEPIACNAVPESLQQQLVKLEEANMAGFERNGDPFSAYFGNAKLILHVARRAGELLGFAICGADSQRTQFLYELHTAQAARKTGIARRLLELVELPRGAKKKKLVKLNVHTMNYDAQQFYEHVGFKRVCTDGMAYVLQR